ncbi:unnamed protein product [Brachionus calyciflorus]|uniref:Uncharacterized protein n=1 Tax=Brachionus calyciflorus TaxID=104777 RepID=A0A814DSZ3_9BILA|nr:unnamed protein product [Brachionus calyciflorus]
MKISFEFLMVIFMANCYLLVKSSDEVESNEIESSDEVTKDNELIDVEERSKRQTDLFQWGASGMPKLFKLKKSPKAKKPKRVKVTKAPKVRKTLKQAKSKRTRKLMKTTTTTTAARVTVTDNSEKIKI